MHLLQTSTPTATRRLDRIPTTFERSKRVWNRGTIVRHQLEELFLNHLPVPLSGLVVAMDGIERDALSSLDQCFIFHNGVVHRPRSFDLLHLHFLLLVVITTNINATVGLVVAKVTEWGFIDVHRAVIQQIDV